MGSGKVKTKNLFAMTTAYGQTTDADDAFLSTLNASFDRMQQDNKTVDDINRLMSELEIETLPDVYYDYMLGEDITPLPLGSQPQEIINSVADALGFTSLVSRTLKEAVPDGFSNGKVISHFTLAKDDPRMPFAGSFSPLSRVLTIFNSAFQNFPDSSRGGNYSVASNVGGKSFYKLITSHELGHSVQNWLEWSQTTNREVERFKSFSKGKASITDYGNSHESESFAECFSAYTLGYTPSQGAEVYSAFKTMMSNVGLSSLENILLGGN